MATQTPAKRRRLSLNAGLQDRPPQTKIGASPFADEPALLDACQLAQDGEQPSTVLGPDRETVCFGAVGSTAFTLRSTYNNH